MDDIEDMAIEKDSVIYDDALDEALDEYYSQLHEEEQRWENYLTDLINKLDK